MGAVRGFDSGGVDYLLFHTRPERFTIRRCPTKSWPATRLLAVSRIETSRFPRMAEQYVAFVSRVQLHQRPVDVGTHTLPEQQCGEMHRIYTSWYCLLIDNAKSVRSCLRSG